MSSESSDRNDGRGRRRGWVAETVRRIQRRESAEEHFELLFRQYEPRVRRLLRCEGFRGADLDDVVQDVMLRVYRGLKGFRFDSSFDTWILRIMTNAAKNARRDRNTPKARAAAVSLDRPPGDEGSAPAVPEPRSREPGPLERTLAGERKARLAAAIDELPPRVRQCLLLRYQGYRYREIARAQGVTLATVKKQITQGHRRLRPILGSWVELFGVFLVSILTR